MALFENYEGRIPQLQPVLDKYGCKDFEEVKAFNNARGVDAYKIVESTQPICFENVKWAYELGAAIAFKEGVMTTNDVILAQTGWLQANSEKIDAEIGVRLCEVYLAKVLGTLGN